MLYAQIVWQYAQLLLRIGLFIAFTCVLIAYMSLCAIKDADKWPNKYPNKT